MDDKSLFIVDAFSVLSIGLYHNTFAPAIFSGWGVPGASA
jgi:hypothetical protein